MKSFKHFLAEEAANVTGSPSSASMSMPSDAKKGPVLRRYRKFKVTNECFNKIKPGLKEWMTHLSSNIIEEKEILEFAAANQDHTIVLENSVTGALRAAYP